MLTNHCLNCAKNGTVEWTSFLRLSIVIQMMLYEALDIELALLDHINFVYKFLYVCVCGISWRIKAEKIQEEEFFEVHLLMCSISEMILTNDCIICWILMGQKAAKDHFKQMFFRNTTKNLAAEKRASRFEIPRDILEKV